MEKCKRLLSMVLVVMLCLSLMPTSVLALDLSGVDILESVVAAVEASSDDSQADPWQDSESESEPEPESGPASEPESAPEESLSEPEESAETDEPADDATDTATSDISFESDKLNYSKITSGVSGSDYTSDSALAAKLDNVFNGTVSLFTNTTAKFELGSSLNNSTQYTVANYYSGYQCYIYAQGVYYYLFGDVPYHGSGSKYWNNSKVALSNCASVSYEIFHDAGIGCGAYIRTTNKSDGSYNGSVGHSMIVLSYDGTYITILEGNADGNGLVRITKYTWDEFNYNQLSKKSRRISHVVQPNSTGPDSCNCTTDYAGQYTCTASSLYIRSGHGTSYSTLGTIPNGATVTVTKGNGTWAHIEYNGISGYAGMKYLSKISTIPAAPTVAAVKSTYKIEETSSITFNWSASEYATGYEYYLFDYSDEFPYVPTVMTKSGTTTGTSLTVSTSEIGSGNYAFCVKAYNGNGISGLSNWARFDVYQNYTPAKTTEYNGHTYVRYDYAVSWMFAKKLCEELGGHLVTVADPGENHVVCALLDESTSIHCWIGLTDYTGGNINEQGTYGWVTGEPITWEHWFGDEPNGSYEGGGKEHFAEVKLLSSGYYGWNDLANNSTEITSFILEIEPVEYTVSYDANGGSGAPASQTKTHNVTLTLSDTTPTRDGYTFLGWSTNSAATSAEYKAGGGYTGNADVTLYAVWEKKTYTVSYDANGGSGAPVSQTKTHNVTLTLSDTTPTRDGYTFLGWSTSSAATSGEYKAGGGYTGNADVTLYAVWEKNAVVDTNAPRIVVSDASAAPGNTVNLTVTVENNPGIASFELTVVYDKEKLNWTGITQGDMEGTWDIAVGESVLWVSAENFAEDGAVVLTLTFEVLAGVEGTALVMVAYDDGDIFDENENDVDFEIISGTIRIRSHVAGDVNGDGNVNNKDILRLMKYLKGKDVEVNEAALDINGDGNVNNKDLLRLMKYLKGKDVEIY